MFLSAILEVFSSVFFFALHVVNTGAFPKALDEKEEARLLELFREHGDENADPGGAEHKDGHPIMLHKPHPGNIVKMYALRQVLEELQSKGYLK